MSGDMVPRGNSAEFDGVFWLEQVRTRGTARRFIPAREPESEEVPLAPGTARAAR